jgi:hypothetical protein
MPRTELVSQANLLLGKGRVIESREVRNLEEVASWLTEMVEVRADSDYLALQAVLRSKLEAMEASFKQSAS